MRPGKWDDSQAGFRGSIASGGHFVLLPGAFWALGASQMATLGASVLLCIVQCFRAYEGMLPPGACRTNRASARHIVSCKGLCAHAPLPHLRKPDHSQFMRFFCLVLTVDAPFSLPTLTLVLTTPVVPTSQFTICGSRFTFGAETLTKPQNHVSEAIVGKLWFRF